MRRTPRATRTSSSSSSRRNASPSTSRPPTAAGSPPSRTWRTIRSGARARRGRRARKICTCQWPRRSSSTARTRSSTTGSTRRSRRCTTRTSGARPWRGSPSTSGRPRRRPTRASSASSTSSRPSSSSPMRTLVRGRLLRSRTLHGFLFTAPLLFLFAAFVIYPMGMGVWFALDADAYRALFSDPIFRQTAINTLWYVGVAVNVKLVLAVLLSGILDYPFRWIRLLAALFLIPWAIPALPGILSFRWMLNSQWGIFNHLLEVFGLPSVPWLAQYWTALGAVMVFHIWKYLPFWTIIFLAGRRAIPNELYEAAAIDGASTEIGRASCRERGEIQVGDGL